MMDSRAFRLVSVVIFSRSFSSSFDTKQSTSVICTSFTSCSSFEEEEDIATVLAFALRSPSLMVFVFLFSALELENRRCVRKLPRWLWIQLARVVEEEEDKKEEQKTALLLSLCARGKVVVFETEQKEELSDDMFVSSVSLWRSKREEKTEDFLIPRRKVRCERY